MNHRTIFLLITILLIGAFAIPCSGVEHYYDRPNLITVSASTMGRGSYIAGGAHVWSQNPLEYWDNPAKLGYARGMAYGNNVHDQKDFYHRRAACISLGWRGIGILLPTLNDYGRFGHSFDYSNDFIHEDEYERSEHYGIGVNLFEAFIGNSSRRNRFVPEISFGMTWQRFMYDWGEYAKSQEQSTVNLGLLALVKPVNIQDFSLEIAAGLNWYNIGKETIEYEHAMFDFTVEEQLMYGLKYSFAAKGTYCPEWMLDSIGRGLFNELVSVAITADYMDYGFSNNDQDYYSEGIELCVLDCLYYRLGNMEALGEDEDDSNWPTYGFGVKLDYRDYVELQWNWAENETGIWIINSYDLMLRVNIMKLITGRN